MRGVIMIGTGDWAQIAAIAAIAFRHHNPDIPVIIATGRKMPAIDGVTWYHTLESPRGIKTSLNRIAPWRSTLYMDADILCLKQLDPEIWKIPLGLIPCQLPAVEHCQHIKGREYDFTVRHYKRSPMYNGGLLKFNAYTGSILFPEWRKEWERFGELDQLALARAIANLGNQLVITELPWIFNYPLNHYTNDAIAENKVQLLHAYTSIIGTEGWLEAAQQLAPAAYSQAQELGVVG